MLTYLETVLLDHGPNQGRWALKSKTRKFFAYTYETENAAYVTGHKIECDWSHMVESVNFSYDYPYSRSDLI